MLHESQLQEVAKQFTSGNIGHAEKLYVQDIILHTVSQETVDQLVFKGGTALLKLYNLDRFSEDLDFTATADIAFGELVDTIVTRLERYGVTVQDRDDASTDVSEKTRLGVQGPLYTGDRRSLCFVRIEVNTESTVHHADIVRYTPPFPDIPAFELVAMTEAEILAEKIRALLTRSQPRDLYDIYHLVSNGVQIDPNLVNNKLSYYDMEYDTADAVEQASAHEPDWERLDLFVYGTLPPFDTVHDTVTAALDDACASTDTSDT